MGLGCRVGGCVGFRVGGDWGLGLGAMDQFLKGDCVDSW